MKNTLPEKMIVHGRRVGKPLSKARQEVVDNLLPKLEISDCGTINPSDLFDGKCDDFALEIGFGDGQHLAQMMAEKPSRGFFGAEPYLNGVANFLRLLPSCASNVRLSRGNAMELIARLPDGCLEAIYILNPDPWPKARHHKRRIVSDDNLDEFARVLKSHGLLMMTTDVDDLAAWMVMHSVNHAQFNWRARNKSDWTKPPNDWQPTKYEKLGTAKGRTQTYLLFDRV